jgi:hypothetical protein
MSDARADNHLVQVMAALAMVSLYPGQKQSGKAYRVLARELLLPNAPITIDLVQMTRLGVTTIPTNRVKPLAMQLELHERAKQALSEGGVLAGEAICKMFESSFWPAGTDRIDLICDKAYARITAFHVLGKIGPPLASFRRVAGGRSISPVRALIEKDIILDRRGFEDGRVVTAAKEAREAIFSK